MRRLGRWIFNGLAALSLVLLVATVGLWVRSYWTVDAIFDFTPARRCDVYSDRGTLCLNITRTDEFRSSMRAWRYWHVSISSDHRRRPAIDDGPHSYAWLGVGYVPNYLSLSGPAGEQFFLPHWLFCLMFLTTPVIWRWRWIRHRRLLRGGRCAICGYDLRATPDRCPECGTVPKIQNSATVARPAR